MLRFFFLRGVDLYAGALCRGVLGGCRDGDGTALSFLSEGEEFCEHEVARGAGEFVDVGGCEVLGGNGVEDYNVDERLA